MTTHPTDAEIDLLGRAVLRAVSVPASEADMVLAAIETGEWELQRLLPQTCFTSEANIRNAWSVKRSAAPYCTKDGLRTWTGATPLEALCNGAAALGVELPGCSETAALPKTVVAILGEQAELRRLSGCCPELNLSNYGHDDVDELNGWAIEVSQCIDRALAAQPAGAQQPIGSNNGWLEAAIAWEVCASLHRQYCKGKDALFTIRQSDFVKHAEDAREYASHGQAPAPAAVAGPRVTDAMALAFHSALSDGAIGSDEVEETKAGLRAALSAAPQQEAQVELDAARLDWLDEDDGSHVSKVGKTWYTRPAYGRPYRKHKNLRAAIDAARKQGANHD